MTYEMHSGASFTPSYLTLASLEAMPTLAVGQTADLKVDTGKFRVWLVRTGVADGEPYDNGVSMEHLDADGCWREYAHAPAT